MTSVSLLLACMVATTGAAMIEGQAKESGLDAASTPPAPMASPDPTREGRSTGGVLYIEQDSVLAPWTDKDYTMGVAVSFSGWRVRRWAPTRVLFAWPMGILNDHVAWFMGNVMGKLDKETGKVKGRGMCLDNRRDHAPDCFPVEVKRPAKPSQYQSAYQTHSLQVGITAFTPRKGDIGVDPNCPHRGCVLHDPNPVYDDRPYASLLYVDYRRQTARGKWAAHSNFTIGVLGLGIANVVQSGIHYVSDPLTVPGGWNHQISDGGEPTLKYTFGGKYLALPPLFWPGSKGQPRDYAGGGTGDPSNRRILDLTLDGECNLGYYTNVATGGRLRLGYVDSPFWGQDRTPVSNSRAPRGIARKRGWISEAYGWASAGYSLWAYNALLQGQFRDSPVTLAFHPGPSHRSVASPMNRAIWDWQVGGKVSVRWLGLSYQYNKYRNLFEGPNKRPHAYWSVSLIL